MSFDLLTKALNNSLVKPIEVLRWFTEKLKCWEEKSKADMKATITKTAEVDNTNEICCQCNKKEECKYGYRFISNHVQKNNWNEYVDTYKCSYWPTA